jgi:deoxyribodipyrimidine photo-lyase
MEKVSVFWFRRDLRLEDNTALFHALKSGSPVICLFIFDSRILDKLSNRRDTRVLFIHRQLESLNRQLQQAGSGLLTRYGNPEEIWKKLCSEYKIASVFTNHDYEPYAKDRDSKVEAILQKQGIKFHTFKDQVIFEKDEVIKDDGAPYTVFTPYKNKWLKNLNANPVQKYPSEKNLDKLASFRSGDVIPLQQMGFESFDFEFPPLKVPEQIIRKYAEQRDLPGVPGTSRLSVHLRFGTVSIRQLALKAIQLDSPVWLNELIWRDFYQMILWHFPHVAESSL